MSEPRVIFENKIRSRGRLQGMFAALTLFVFLVGFGVATAQSPQTLESTNIAKTVLVSDAEVSYGDIILYDPETNLYRLSVGQNDPRFYGVVVEDPALVMENQDRVVPVVESGLMPVNVSLEGGDIDVGDPITTSSTAGNGMRALDDQLNVFGFARESLAQSDAVPVGEEGALGGTILVEVGGERLRSYIAQKTGTLGVEGMIGGVGGGAEGDSASGTRAVMRFGFASSVALGAIFLIFFAFLSSIKQGVISVGRNPRAKASIQSMIVLNVILAIVITAAAIFFAIALLVIGE